MESPVRFVGPENFEREITTEEKPVLLVCVPRNEQFFEVLRIVERIAKRCGQKLKVCLLEEGFIRPFQERYGVFGTPTFLILVKGEERNRLLGLADEETLMHFITTN